MADDTPADDELAAALEDADTEDTDSVSDEDNEEDPDEDEDYSDIEGIELEDALTPEEIADLENDLPEFDDLDLDFELDEDSEDEEE